MLLVQLKEKKGAIVRAR